MKTQLESLHQRNMDLVLQALRDKTSLSAVYDEDAPTDWDERQRPCAWVSEQGMATYRKSLNYSTSARGAPHSERRRKTK